MLLELMYSGTDNMHHATKIENATLRKQQRQPWQYKSWEEIKTKTKQFNRM